MVETELHIINISIIFLPLDSTCINHHLHRNHKDTAPMVSMLLYVPVSLHLALETCNI